MSTYDDVLEFHRAFGHPVGNSVLDNGVDAERSILRMGLIVEEFIELQTAVADNDFVEIADAIADSIYVLTGYAIELGIPLDAVLAEVHRSNMTKLGEDGKPIYREDGKILKGPFFEAPNLEGILFDEE